LLLREVEHFAPSLAVPLPRPRGRWGWGPTSVNHSTNSLAAPARLDSFGNVPNVRPHAPAPGAGRHRRNSRSCWARLPTSTRLAAPGRCVPQRACFTFHRVNAPPIFDQYGTESCRESDCPPARVRRSPPPAPPPLVFCRRAQDIRHTINFSPEPSHDRIKRALAVKNAKRVSSTYRCRPSPPHPCHRGTRQANFADPVLCCRRAAHREARFVLVVSVAPRTPREGAAPSVVAASASRATSASTLRIRCCPASMRPNALAFTGEASAFVKPARMIPAVRWRKSSACDCPSRDCRHSANPLSRRLRYGPAPSNPLRSRVSEPVGDLVLQSAARTPVARFRGAPPASKTTIVRRRLPSVCAEPGARRIGAAPKRTSLLAGDSITNAHAHSARCRSSFGVGGVGSGTSESALLRGHCLAEQGAVLPAIGRGRRVITVRRMRGQPSRGDRSVAAAYPHTGTTA